MSLIKLAALAKTNSARERPVDFGGMRPKMHQLDDMWLNLIQFRIES